LDTFDEIKKTLNPKTGDEDLDGLGTAIKSAEDTQSLSVGSLFANRYEILSEGMRGGMGVVYKCIDTWLKDVVALKVIHPRLLESREAVERFHQEVKISQKLNHKNIVRVHDLNIFNGIEFFTMEWVEGGSLREILIKRKKENWPFSLEEAYRILSQLADALQHAHQFTVHRDIKPENILGFEKEGRLQIKLTDFGIAKILTPSQLRLSGVKGTPYYMAPEQKEEGAVVDKRADIYSVGVVLFEFLTLRNTIGPYGPSKLNKEIPKEVDVIFERAVEPEPDNRYQDIKELADALREVIQRENKSIEEEQKEAEELRKRGEGAELDGIIKKIERLKPSIEKKWPPEAGEVALGGQEESLEEGLLFDKIELQEIPEEVERRSLHLETHLKKEILIYTSDENTREEFLRIFFKNNFYHLVFTDSEQNALLRAKLFKPDMFIVEVRLIGELNGIAVCKAIKSDQELRDIPVILLIDTSEEVSEREWQSIGADAIISKPFRERYVRKLVASIFSESGQRRLEKETRKQYIDPFTGMEFVFVKGGEFEMGDTFGDGLSDEKPPHEVRVSDFWIGKYTVTQGQWQKMMGNNPSYFKSGDNYPVEQVSWDDVQGFIQRLNQRTGKKYRLPTEAEWEFAARSGGKKEKWAGTSDESEFEEYAWYDKNSGKQTHPVGQKKPNALGLYDMSGNVLEWCGDWYDEKYYQNSPKNDPRGPSSGQYKVLRGSSWGIKAVKGRASGRGWFVPTERVYTLGFRLVSSSG